MTLTTNNALYQTNCGWGRNLHTHPASVCWR